MDLRHEESQMNYVVPIPQLPHINCCIDLNYVGFCMNLFRFINKSIKQAKQIHSMANPNELNYFIWIDLEMTGLIPEKHKIVEIACVITTPELGIINDGLEIVVHQPKEVFDYECDNWPRQQHTKSGLMNESLKSKIDVKEADSLVSDFIKKSTNYDSNKGTYYLAGSSIYMDKRFLEKYMPRVNGLLHYRLIDVSTIKVLTSLWYPEKFATVKDPTSDHRALSDIKNSIEKLRLYRKNFFF